MSAKRKVLLLAASFEMGGAEGQILLLARLLLEGGRYGVHLACLRRRGLLLEEAERLGVGDIPEFPLTSFYDWNMAAQLRRFSAFLREREVSVVHTEGSYSNVFGITGAALLICRPWLEVLPSLLARLSVAFLMVAVSLLVFSALPAGRLAMRSLKEMLMLMVKRDRESVA